MLIDYLDPQNVVVRALLERNALQSPDQAAFLFEDGSTWTFRQCLLHANAAAHEYRAAGVTQGCVVAIALPNSPDYLRAWWGAAMLGATVVAINPAYRGHLVSHILDLAKPSVIVTRPDFRSILTDIGLPGATVILDPSDLAGTNVELPALDRPIEPWDAAFLAPTSGTTGPSKLVRVSCAHSLQGGTSSFDLWGKTNRDVYLCDIPLFHMGCLYMVVASLYHRNKVALRSRPELARYWEVVRDAGATFSQIYSSMVTFLDAQPERPAERSHSLRMAVVIPFPQHPEAFKKRFGIEHLIIGWGSTETGCPLVSQPGFDLPAGSTGRPVPGYQVKIVDEHDVEVSHDVSGEAVVSCEAPWLISTEYVGNPAATAMAWRNGWFHTGDIMRRDAAGNFFFVDRVKDCLRRRGQNISSYDVEKVVQMYPGVAEAAVVPERNATDVEDEVKVWILPDAGVELDFRMLLHFCAERLPHYMVPRFFEVTETFPRTPSEKVQKHVLRERGNGAGTWDRLDNGLDVTRHGVREIA